MTSQEHIVAVVEPEHAGDSTIDIAERLIDRGGRATVVVLFSRKTADEVSAFADAEDLTYPDAHEIFVERLTAGYLDRFGVDTTVVFENDASDTDRAVFNRVARDAATSVVMPQRLVTRRKWKTSVARSTVPVVIAPPRAA